MTEDIKETWPAQGRLMTEIRCPKCSITFCLDGNCEREMVECPDCEAQICVMSKW
jgi:hypothetical protein